MTDGRERPFEVGPAASEEAAERAIESFRREVHSVEREVARVIVGQSRVVREVLTAVLADGHVLLEGVPGIGKTLLVRSLASTLGLGFSRVQCTPDLTPADVTGTQILLEDEGRTRRLEFRPGPLFANIVLADEINRATPKTQSAFLEAMEERQVTTAGETHPLPVPFLLLATQNPIEMEGTFPLPEAQIDRFLFKVLVDYPTHDDLVRIGRETTGPAREEVAAVLDRARLVALQRFARRVPVATEVLEAAARLVRATHPEDAAAPEEVRRHVRCGVSARAIQALILGAKVGALLDGRAHVARRDLAAVAPVALRHRLLLHFEASASAVEVDAILARITERVLA